MSVLRGGLLVEGARTNLALRSEEFGDASWTKISGAVTDNVAIAPDGTMTADRFTPSNTIAASGLARNVTVSAGVHTSSVYVRYTNSQFVQMVFNGTLSSEFANFDLINGTVTGGTYISASITPAAFGFWRLSLTATLAATTNLVFPILAINAGTSGRSALFTGDGVENYIVWGAQLELGSFASSYIPTVAATVTRATDQVSYANFPQPSEIAARDGMTLYWAGVDLGTRETVNAFLYSVGNTNTLVRTLELRASAAGVYRLGIGSDAGDVVRGATAPTVNSFGEVLCQVEYRLNGSTPEFRVRPITFQNGAVLSEPAFSAWLDATTLIANGWNTSPTLHVGARDGGNNPGFALHQSFKAAFGVQTIDYMRGLV